MANNTLTLGWWTVNTYTLILGLGIIFSIGLGVFRKAGQRAVVLDVYLGGLVGGVVLARVVYVLLNWNYYAFNLSEATRLNAGGLNWHGAVMGALLGIWLTSRWVGFAAWHDVLDNLTWGLPILALAGWLGCWSAACAYGAEVTNMADYAPVLTADLPDIYGIYAPRFHTALLGSGLAGALFVVSLIMLFWQRLRYRRLWLILVLLSIGMFGIGFLRGDTALRLTGLRLDQWLDIGLIAFGLWQVVVSPKRSPFSRQLSTGNV